MDDLKDNKINRLDNYVTAKLKTVSRAFAGKVIESGSVKVNNVVQTKSGYNLKSNDKVKISYDLNQETTIPDIDIPIIYEDESCVVINKPIGVLSHSKGAFNPEASVASWLEPKTKGFEDNDRAGIVHRLDRLTSGVMICAKTPEAATWLQKQFQARKTKKTYLAIIEGQPEPSEAIIDLPIMRNPKKPQTFRVSDNGKRAITAYKVLDSNEDYSLIELKPTTGRTHQLRVHMKQVNHPILGDTLYGGQASDRMYLHAKSLEITLPSKQRMTFESDTPKEFRKIFKNLT